jgi:ACS family pantothenate transporter-like MFS transporter
MGNDFAYVVQAVAPNFVWKTTQFPAAKNGYLWCIVLQVLLSKLTHFNINDLKHADLSFLKLV